MAIFTLIEVIKPARKIRYRDVFWADFSSTLVVIGMAVFLSILFQKGRIWFHDSIVAGFNQLYYSAFFNWFHQTSFIYQLIIYLIAADFGIYWAHRFMHSRHLWRFHRWHHSPTYMYWGAGLRSSLMHQFLFLSVGVMATLFLPEVRPGMYFLFGSTHFIISNNFMHMNTSWESDKLEWIFVTPRYHRVHHCTDISVHNANYGAIFSFWDRLFKSHINPAKIKHFEFGTGEKKKHPLMFLGF
jgi:sterol desaturase/sphingolipid hydroxylase (fatty acid hydroxylase superfamily)